MKYLFFAIFACLALPAFSVHAQDMGHPPFHSDDRVMFDVSAEDWVTTKTAHVSVTVEAAVNASTAGTMREEMNKAVNALAKGDWRLTSFNRTQDQTGMERWSAVYETRLAETDIGGLADSAKKLSKAGMQLSVGTIDFTPTLEEMEAARSALRVQIYKIANDQLAELNVSLPGRTYRIALVDFTGDDDSSPMPHVIKGPMAMHAMMAVPAAQTPDESSASLPVPVDRSEKVTLTARIVLAASPAEEKPAMPPINVPPVPVPAGAKH